ncbi:MAG: cupin domain-containing protein [Christensenellaceae bacterium]
MIEKFNLQEKVDGVTEFFQYLRIGTLNDHMLNVLQAENRTLPFHIHEDSDEMFYCIEGSFAIEFDDGLTPLSAGDAIIIPKGTRHRPVCKEPVKCLLIERAGTLDASNTGGTYQAPNKWEHPYENTV